MKKLIFIIVFSVGLIAQPIECCSWNMWKYYIGPTLLIGSFGILYAYCMGWFNNKEKKKTNQIGLNNNNKNIFDTKETNRTTIQEIITKDNNTISDHNSINSLSGDFKPLSKPTIKKKKRTILSYKTPSTKNKDSITEQIDLHNQLNTQETNSITASEINNNTTIKGFTSNDVNEWLTYLKKLISSTENKEDQLKIDIISLKKIKKKHIKNILDEKFDVAVTIKNKVTFIKKKLIHVAQKWAKPMVEELYREFKANKQIVSEQKNKTNDHMKTIETLKKNTSDVFYIKNDTKIDGTKINPVSITLNENNSHKPFKKSVL